MPQELKIAMLGSRGVGKTSLLTALYREFGDTIGKTGLQLIPDEESSSTLQKRLGELEALLDDFEATAGIKGTGDPQCFTFDIGEMGTKPSLRLRFQDFPGGWLSENATTEQRSSVKKFLTESVAILIPVDAPALMEGKGKWHSSQNIPKQINDLFANVYQDMKSPRLVIFAPIKCEKYMKSSQTAAALLKSIKEGYADLLRLFCSEKLSPWVASVVTPVQTVGTVVFSRIEKINDEPHFFYKKISHEAQYSPQDSDQPLRYLLRFSLKLHLEQRKAGFRGFFRERLNMNEYLKSAIKECSKECKSTHDGFEIIQGQKWLNIE